jgi:hypothetical protein
VIFTSVGGAVFHTAGGIAVGEAAAGWVAVVIALTVVSRVVKRLSSDEALPDHVSEQDATLTKVTP